LPPTRISSICRQQGLRANFRARATTPILYQSPAAPRRAREGSTVNLTDYRAVLAIGGIVSVAALLSARPRTPFPFLFVTEALLLELLVAQVLKLPFLEAPVREMAQQVRNLMSFSAVGIHIVFGSLADQTPAIFAISILPVVIYFSALLAVAFYTGLMQFLTRVCAHAISLACGRHLTGPEAVAAAANIFVGQMEAPLCIGPQIHVMNRSQLMSMMTCGFATMAATVSVLYAGLLSANDSEVVPIYLLFIMRATVLAIPAAILMAKIMVPPDPGAPTAIPPVQAIASHSGLLDAIAHGARQGVQLAVNIGAMVIVFAAMLALIDAAISATVGNWVWTVLPWSSACELPASHFGVRDLLGYLLAPIAYLLGIRWADACAVGRLMGVGIFATEYRAFYELMESPSAISRESFVLAIFALSSFANLPSIGVQVAGLSNLCPTRRADFVALAPRAMVAGLLASWLGAAMAGLCGLAI